MRSPTDVTMWAVPTNPYSHFLGDATAAEEDSEDGCEVESKTLPNRSRSPPPLTVAPALASGHPYNRHHLFQPARISPFQSFTSHFLPR